MLKLNSPAKINLFLRILRKREDGYHELASLFQAVDLCDTIDFALQKDDLLTCDVKDIPLDHSNLILKAANLFRKKTHLSFGLRAHLEKRIPHQAGFGGGSSNAATTLWALNELCNRPATIDELITWSAEIGSDISFFLSEGTAYCTGRGEIMRSLSPLPNTQICLVKPEEGLSTPHVYQNLKPLELSQRDPQLSLNGFLNGNPDYFNDLEQSAFSVMPKLADLKKSLLQSGFHTALLSGSGSGFFCIGPGDLKKFSQLSYYQASFINRIPNSWYLVA